jgi:hypothetical protein
LPALLATVAACLLVAETQPTMAALLFSFELLIDAPPQVHTGSSKFHLM